MVLKERGAKCYLLDILHGEPINFNFSAAAEQTAQAIASFSHWPYVQSTVLSLVTIP